MTGLLELRRRAEEACQFRGHQLGKWITSHGESHSIANNECEVCRLWVQCDTKPMPNGIDIGGPAVAVNCDGIQREEDE